MTTVAIIQARLGSERLPGKVLAPIAGRSMLAWVVARAQAAATVDQVVVATTTAAEDDAVEVAARAAGAGVFRGERADVLGRYLGAARTVAADRVVRLTADCPLLDPAVIDAVVEALATTPGCDYASNTVARTYPRGLDVEAMPLTTLVRLDAVARAPAHREHVTAYLTDNPAGFARLSVCAAVDHSDLRWTVDTEVDLALVRAIYAGVAPTPATPYLRIVDWLRARPELSGINAGVNQRSWRHHDRRESCHG